jgi:hypothetical protein
LQSPCCARKDAAGTTSLCDHGNNIMMERNLTKVTYKGYRTGLGWEVVVQRPGQRLRLLQLPRSIGGWARAILTDYLEDESRVADLHEGFDALTVRRFTDDWELSENDIENSLMQVEILRARWRAALMRG